MSEKRSLNCCLESSLLKKTVDLFFSHLATAFHLSTTEKSLSCILPALLGMAGGRRVGALQGYEGGSERMAGDGTGASLGGGGGRVDGQVGVKEAGRGGGGGGGGPRGLSRIIGNLVGSEWTGEGGRG